LLIQISRGQTFRDVCPLLVQNPGNSSYLHPVRIAKNIHLLAANLPPAVSAEYSKQLPLF